MSVPSQPLCSSQLFAYSAQQAVTHVLHEALCTSLFLLVPSSAEIDRCPAGDHSGLHLHIGNARALQARYHMLNLRKQSRVVCRISLRQQRFQIVASGQRCIPFGVGHE